MYKRLAVALAACVFTSSAFAQTPHLVPLGSLNLQSEWDGFGGLSGLDVSPDGSVFWAVSDDGVLYKGALERTDATDDLSSARVDEIHLLTFAGGLRPDEKADRDLEGLSVLPDGTVLASAEHKDILWSYSRDFERVLERSLPVRTGHFRSNKGFEALAVSPKGDIVVIPETSGSFHTPFSVYSGSDQSVWRIIFEIPRAAGYLPVGADFGPDGHLYVLFRAFSGFTFSSRIARVTYESGVPKRYEELFTSDYGAFDNLEGLAVWQTKAGETRLIAVSDDNFSNFQRTHFTEFTLKE